MAYNRPYNPDALPQFAEPERKTPSGSSGPSLTPSHYDTKPAPARPHDSYGRPHASPAGRLSPSGHNTGFASTMSPPPTGGPRPTPIQNRPPPVSRPPPSPAPTEGGADPTLLPLFRAVDKDRTGQLSERELSAALVNGDWTAFDPHTVRMMIRMFDSDRSGTIGFDEFCGLWSFLASWRTLFDRFDADKSGNIQLDEFNNALVAFRYRLSERFVELLFQTYDKRNEGVLSFDLFVQACISLKRMTDVFKKYDDDRDGYITLSFEDFLTEILRQLK
ncbi:Programmed cell death protein 6 [Cytospora mali]|uniref:Programmed cell death protein 6 n=1 Tax=Cytospora mali TaxID=578113 RepID=A0A194VS35_CYTMA|nr:Programmed cell death protein 6 [Valsa mali]